jgi:hypothetical protein
METSDAVSEFISAVSGETVVQAYNEKWNRGGVIISN